MSRVAILDIDDTIGDMRSLLCQTLNNHTGKDIHWSQWDRFRVEELYDVTYDEFFKLLQRDSIVENMHPHPESASFSQDLKAADYRVALLTARNWHPESREVTERWLASHGIAYDDLLICDVETKKADMIKDVYGSVHFTVDDSVAQNVGYIKSRHVENVFVYDMPWNRINAISKSRAIRVSNLNNILKILD